MSNLEIINSTSLNVNIIVLIHTIYYLLLVSLIVTLFCFYIKKSILIKRIMNEYNLSYEVLIHQYIANALIMMLLIISLSIPTYLAIYLPIWNKLTHAINSLGIENVDAYNIAFWFLNLNRIGLYISLGISISAVITINVIKFWINSKNNLIIEKRWWQFMISEDKIKSFENEFISSSFANRLIEQRIYKSSIRTIHLIKSEFTSEEEKYFYISGYLDSTINTLIFISKDQTKVALLKLLSHLLQQVKTEL